MTTEANQIKLTANHALLAGLLDAFTYLKARLTGHGSAHTAFRATLAVASAVWAVPDPYHFIDETWSGFMLIATLGTLALMVYWFRIGSLAAHTLSGRMSKQRKPVASLPYLAD